MKTTIDVSDSLLVRAKRHARRTGKPLRAVIEDGLRRVLDSGVKPAAYSLPDRSVGDRRAIDPLESMSWTELRNEIYGGR